MPAPLLWAVGFAMGIAAWVALLWLLVTGARTAVSGVLAGFREAGARWKVLDEEREVAQLDAVRRDREERVARRAASRARRLAA